MRPSLRPDPAIKILVVGFLAAAVAMTAHAWLVRAWGSAVPFWDQWDAEARQIYLPWAEGRLRWADLFTAHNEHRLLLTHLQNLFLLTANGRWDPLAQMLVNASWLGLTVGLLTIVLLRVAPHLPRGLALFVPLLFAAPFGWQNTLWGFQSQHYFALLFSVTVGVGLGLAAPFSAGWWAGVIAGLLAPLSSAGGILGAVATLAALGWAAGAKARPWREVAPSAIAAGALLLVALCWRVDPPGHLALKARDAGQFLRVWAGCLAWPSIDLPFAALLAFAPFTLALFQLRQSPRRGEPLTIFIVFIGALALAHATALAYARANGLIYGTPLSRYQDPLALAAFANLLALWQLRPVDGDAAARQRWTALAVLWTAWFALGLARLSWLNIGSHLPFQAEGHSAQLRNLTSYLTTHDPSALAGKSLYEISHSSAPDLQAMLDSPTLRPLLPLELQPAGTAPTAPERAIRGFLRISSILFFANLAALAAVVFRRRLQPLAK